MRKLLLLGVVCLTTLAFAATAFAGPGCAKASKAKSAAACSYKGKTALNDINVETSRMESGALVVFYTSDKPEVVEALQAKAAEGASAFDCGICKQVAASENCKIEFGTFAGGVVAFISSEEPTNVDAYEKQFAAMLTPDAVN